MKRLGLFPLLLVSSSFAGPISIISGKMDINLSTSTATNGSSADGLHTLNTFTTFDLGLSDIAPNEIATSQGISEGDFIFSPTTNTMSGKTQAFSTTTILTNPATAGSKAEVSQLVLFEVTEKAYVDVNLFTDTNNLSVVTNGLASLYEESLARFYQYDGSLETTLLESSGDGQAQTNLLLDPGFYGIRLYSYVINDLQGSNSFATVNSTAQFGIEAKTYQAVPEPATMAVLGLGLLAALRRRR